MQRLRGDAGGVLAPDLLDEPLGGDHLARVEQQHREQRAAPAAAQLELPPAGPNLQRAEDAEIHPASILARGLQGKRAARRQPDRNRRLPSSCPYRRRAMRTQPK
jgi:hypothetical protein